MQEVKRGQAKTIKNWKKQLLQVLMYVWVLEQVGRFYNFRGYILNTEDIFVYIFKEDVEFLRKQLWAAFEKGRALKYSPSSIHKYDVALNILNTPLNFKIKELDDKFLLNVEINTIIKH